MYGYGNLDYIFGANQSSGEGFILERIEGLLLWLDASEPTKDLLLFQASDHSGNDNHGALTNMDGQTVYAEDVPTGSLYERSIDLDGTNDYVAVGDQAELDFGAAQDFSASVEFKPDVQEEAMVFSKGANGATAGYYLSTQADGTVRFEINDGTTAVQVDSTSTYTAGEWSKVDIFLDRDGNGYLTVDDGDAEGTIDISTVGDIDTAAEFNIGQYDDDSLYFNGHVSDLQVYDDLTQTNLVGHWKLDGKGAGTESAPVYAALDKSRNANHAIQKTVADQMQSGDRTINGLNALDLDGTEELDMGANVALTGEWDIWTVLIPDVVTSGIILDTTQGNYNFAGAATNRVQDGVANHDMIHATAYTLGNEYCIRMYRNASDEMRCERDGVDSGESPTSAVDFTVNALGRFAAGMNGAVALLLIFDHVLNADEVKLVEEWITAKWGIAFS